MAVTREQVRAYYEMGGFEVVKGHPHLLKKEVDGVEYRVALRPRAARLERLVRHSDGSTTWVRIRSGYYGRMAVTDNGELLGMSR